MQSVLKISDLKLGKSAHAQFPRRERSGTVTKPPRVWEAGGLSSLSCFRTLEGHDWHQSHMAEQMPFLQSAVPQPSPAQIRSLLPRLYLCPFFVVGLNILFLIGLHLVAQYSSPARVELFPLSRLERAWINKSPLSEALLFSEQHLSPCRPAFICFRTQGLFILF